MAGRESTGVLVAPVFLRLALGMTFLWAGLGKFVEEIPVRGEQAAVLANLGVIVPFAPGEGRAAPEPTTPTTPTTPTAPTPSASPPEPTPVPKAEPNPEPRVEPKAEPKPGAVPAPKPEATPAAPKPEPKPEPVPRRDPTGSPLSWECGGAVVLVAQDDGRRYHASDFPQDVKVKRVYGLALLLLRAADPPADAQGRRPGAIWPAALAGGGWPIYLAWGAAICEVLGGLLVLVGLLTRVASFSLAVVIASAAWLTQIGPAMQSGNATLGILPGAGLWEQDAAGNPAHAMLLWQFALGMGALALTFIGPGMMSFDRVLFAPAPPPAKPGGNAAPAKKE